MPDANSELLLKAVRQMGNDAWYFQKTLSREDDIWLASYPRSGSHLARFILISARHFNRHGCFPTDLSGMKSIPDVHGGRLEFAAGTPRIIKTHFPRDPRYRRIIHLVRDPRDVIISYFHYSQGLPHLFYEPVTGHVELPHFVDLFLRGKIWPGDIREHSATYSCRPHDIAYTRIRYEALLSEPRREYSRLLDAAGLSLPGQALDSLIEHTSFTNMRRLHTPETARVGMVETNPIYIMRSGVAGQHASELNDQIRQRIEAEMAEYIDEYGFR